MRRARRGLVAAAVAALVTAACDGNDAPSASFAPAVDSDVLESVTDTTERDDDIVTDDEVATEPDSSAGNDTGTDTDTVTDTDTGTDTGTDAGASGAGGTGDTNENATVGADTSGDDTEEAGEGQVAGDDAPDMPAEWSFDGALISTWGPDAAGSIERTEATTMPQIVQSTLEPVVEGHWIWDSWPLRDPDGNVADVDGWTVMFGLSAEITGDRVPGDRHGLATWRMFGMPSSGDGAGEWTDLGPVWSDGEALGGRQWAGSSVLDPSTGQVRLFYTALGDLPSNEQLTSGPASDPYEDVNWTGGANLSSGPDRQQMVETTAELEMSDGRPTLTSSGEHTIVLTADGAIYRTAAQAAESDQPYVFRDPWWFRDLDTGREYLLFSASPAFLTGSSAGGVVGLAAKDDGDWVPLQPLLVAAGVNSQLERPHLVIEGDRTYLFVSSHGFSFLDGIDGPPGLYGFVSEQGLGGRFVPINDSGLVMANPAAAEQQSYSWIVLPDGRVLSFANYFDLDGVGGLSGIAGQSVDWQRDHFGGTLAPFVQLELDDAEAVVR